MKLSEAMRKGAQFAPHGYGAYVRDELGKPGYYYATELRKPIGDRITSTCAWGAAAHGYMGFGATLLEVQTKAEELSAAFPEVHTRVWMKNDRRHMTREQIADWLEEQGL